MSIFFSFLICSNNYNIYSLIYTTVHYKKKNLTDIIENNTSTPANYKTIIISKKTIERLQLLRHVII